MDKKIVFGRSIKDILLAVSPSFLIGVLVLVGVYFYIDPAPPSKLVITTGDGEGDYHLYAEQYKKILKEDGIELEVRPSKGPAENLRRLQDENSGVDVGFVPDGLGTTDNNPDVVSFGSIYYEPMWIFYRGTPLTRLSELAGKRIAIGNDGSGSHVLALKLLKGSGIDHTNAKFTNLGGEPAAAALRKGDVDVMMLLMTAEDELVEEMIRDPKLHLMSLDQAQAMTRQVPYLHHLTLPHGVFDLQQNLPASDIHMVAPTVTLLARDDVHPALVYLLLRAAGQVHGDPGIFENKGEFPVDKDSTFPIDRDARAVYKSGAPFWQRYLPFWLATLIDRFILIAIPVIAILLPLVRLVPRVYTWRIRSRIYQRYGELKFLETQIKPAPNATEYATYFSQLDAIEERVNKMKVPLEFSEHLYSLRGHIEMVRQRLDRSVAGPLKS